jgi:hypothetical protein
VLVDGAIAVVAAAAAYDNTSEARTPATLLKTRDIISADRRRAKQILSGSKSLCALPWSMIAVFYPIRRGHEITAFQVSLTVQTNDLEAIPLGHGVPAPLTCNPL